MLDAGQELDPHRAAMVARLGAADHRHWTPADLDELTDNPTISTSKVPKKLVFGSDFLYAGKHPLCPTEAEAGIAANPTLAKGGFSIAWGGAMLPMADTDMADWPFRRAALESSYRRVLQDIPVCGSPGLLDEHFPILREQSDDIRLPQQAADLLKDFTAAAATRRKNDNTLLCGQARLALHGAAAGGQGCRYCGRCLSGCVYHAIHTFDQDIAALARDGRITYRGGLMVSEIREEGEAVLVRWRGLADQAPGEQRFKRVFLAAGALNSARILLESAGRFDTPLRFQDSRKFVLPMLRLRRQRLQWPDVNALPALFMEARFPDVTPHWLHMQISVVNDFVLQRLGVTPGKGLKWALLGPAVERLMIAWGGLHSTLSDGFEARLQRGTDAAPGTLALRILRNPQTLPMIKRLTRRLIPEGLRFGTLFLPLPTVSDIGGGNHFGGSFPMTREPARFEQSDLLGRPAGLRRVHLVDGSVLPSLPATTVALVIMANADRIVHEAPLHE
ncbi:hypothetical protein [Ferrovibrio sp.]|uniref:hypothetical protein n=1 Tax=Ferrovibrio sp. TaxID=1917215 RepID=UPI003D100877